MKAKPKQATVARQHPLLYLYAGLNILGGISSIARFSFHSGTITRSQGVDPQALHRTLLIMLCITLVLYTTALIYLITSKKLKNVALELKIFLAFDLIGLVMLVMHLSYGVFFGILQTAFTYMVLRSVLNKKDIILF